ncbi:hypothetical protein [Geobacter sp.]|uniref:hypothetical protein n=1 Tax=Geobacter sp. TaxID=46610 RepID=UPI00261F9F0F|nr:hypothetical protein [Geobacter sp.]
MRCPVCRTHEKPVSINLHTEGFSEAISTCSICGAVWSVNHGVTEIVEDPQEKSFLEALSECVEADDYSFAA